MTDYKKEAMTARIITALRNNDRKQPVAYFGKYPDSDTWYNSINKDENTMVCFVSDIVKLNVTDVGKLTEADTLKIESWVSWKDIYEAFDPSTFSGGSHTLPEYKTVNLVAISNGGCKAVIDTPFFTITATTQKAGQWWEIVLSTPKGDVIIPIEKNYKEVHLAGLAGRAIKKSNPFLS